MITLELKVNQQVVGTLEIRRITEDGAEYRWVLVRGAGGAAGIVLHRYEDGAWELVRKVLEAAR